MIISKIKSVSLQVGFVMLLILLVLTSCENDPEIMTLEESEELKEEVVDGPTDFELALEDMCTSTGKRPKMPQLKIENQLLRIEQINLDNNIIDIDSFIYDEKDQLVGIKEALININEEYIDRGIHKLAYQDSLLLSISYLRDQELIRKDSLTYNEEANLSTIFRFSRNGGPSIPLNYIDSFFYDAEAYLSYSSSFWVSQGKYSSHAIYCWEDGNMRLHKNYAGDGSIRYESSATYSDEEIFRVSRLDPRNWLNPVVWSRNSVLDSDFIDHVGNIDFLCNPCEWVRQYDEKNRLISEENGFTRRLYTYRN